MPRQTPYPHHGAQAPSVRGGGKRYDAVVIGGGPAGLSAAIYLARYNRSVLVVDAGQGRSTSHELNQNYLGFPAGVRSRELRALGAKQARRFGAKFLRAQATSVRRDADGFAVRCGRKSVHGRTLVLATGVIDSFPEIDGVERYVGVSLFWCITCDGWKARNRRVLVVGNGDDAAVTAMQFLNFTPRVTLLTNSARTQISPKRQRALDRAGIELVRDTIASVGGAKGKMRAVTTAGGRVIALDMMFNSQGCEPNVALAKQLRLKLDGGFIKTDNEQRTSVQRVYAAGDVTKAFAHQVVTAAHEGATAGQAANYDLYRPEQRE